MERKRNIVTIRNLFLSALLLLAVSMPAHARKSVILSERIHTLQVSRNGDWQELPVMTLGTDDIMQISFDESSHSYHRLKYHIRHCNADWKESGLSENDFLDGFNDRFIEEYENSRNTTFKYTHYILEFPNKDVTLTKSGNYEVAVTDEDNDEKLFIARFAIMEELADINASVTGNTDTDVMGTHQQLSFTVNYSRFPTVYPMSEILVRVTQNNCDATELAVDPSYFSQNELTFSHHPKLVFNGGNEYRRFEIIDMYSYLQRVDRVDFYDPYFHATLLQDKPIRQYRYDEDHNGRYLIRKHDARWSEIEADYLFVHFTLQMPEKSGGHLYIDGDFTDAGDRKRWKMEYNQREGCYEKAVLLKMGAYDYRYLWYPDSSDKPVTSITEGDSYETANDYQIYVWFRQQGSRYDRLVGLKELKMTR